MDVNTETMVPHSDIQAMLTRARSLTVKIGKDVYTGAAALTDDGAGGIVLEFPAPKAKPKAKGKAK